MQSTSIAAINEAEGTLSSIITARQIIIIAMHSNNFICVLILQLLPFPHQQLWHMKLTLSMIDFSWSHEIHILNISQDLFIYLHPHCTVLCVLNIQED